MDCLFFDCESAVDVDRLPLFEADLVNRAHDELDYHRPGTKGGWAGDPEADAILLKEKIALLGAVTPEYARLIGLNLGVDDAAPRSGWVGEDRGDGPLTERDLLEAFWSSAKQAKCIVGFNSIRFDLPLILVRSAILGVEPTVAIYDSKPWQFQIVDLLALRWPRFAGSEFQSLKALRRILQLPISGKYDSVADMNGGDVGALWAAGDFEKCRLYGESDIELTRALARHWGGYFYPMIMERSA